MKLPPPFYAAGEHIAVNLDRARALFTTRRGGVSAGPYASMNLGRWTADDPAAVEHNRELLHRQVGARLAYGRQVHGSTVIRHASPQPPEMVLEPADGHATALRGVGPMVLTADCLPIAVSGGKAVAMLHAGWRGLAEGVIEEGVRSLRELGDDGPLSAAIGPGAGPCCYEVGEEVHAQFADSGPQARRGANLDLKHIARLALSHAGVGSVHDVGLCTICGDPSLFYSHRRDQGVTGRQAGVAWLT